jgi:hypothetical protein
VWLVALEEALILPRFNGYPNLFSSPLKSFAMGAKVEIYPFRPFNSPSSVFYNPPAVAWDIHPCTKGIIGGVCCNSAIMGEKIPRKEYDAHRDHPRPINGICRKKTLFRFSWIGPIGRKTAVWPTFARTCTYILVPEIKFEPSPTPSFPATAG